MTAFVFYATTRESNYKPCFTAKTGNIITTSKISVQKCMRTHMKKVADRYGDVSIEIKRGVII